MRSVQPTDIPHWKHTSFWGCMWEIIFSTDLLGQLPSKAYDFLWTANKKSI